MVMPGLSGPALYQQAQAAGGPIRFLFISGYADDAIAGAGHRATLLPKPFTPAQLVAAVSTALLSEA
jgi:two-component system cell cycle sensor histidine kinase/response regulator CckA